MPNRILRDWTDSIRFEKISAEAERLFARLIMKADDYGRFHADPRLVKSACFPLLMNLRANTTEDWIKELISLGLVFCYEVEHRKLLAIINYGQRLKMSRAKFPPPAGEPEDWMPVSNHFPEVPGSSRKFPSESDAESESETHTESDANPPKPPRGRAVERKRERVGENSHLQNRIGAWFRRRESTLWTVEEAEALRQINPAEDEISEMGAYYTAPEVGDRDCRRHDLLTLLNNWSGELDRARRWKAGRRKDRHDGDF